jgi:hypothetical protein
MKAFHLFAVVRGIRVDWKAKINLIGFSLDRPGQGSHALKYFNLDEFLAKCPPKGHDDDDRVT